MAGGKQLSPMLAAPVTDLPIQFPGYVSPKVDGIRGWVPTPGGILTRTRKPIPNKYVQACTIDSLLLHGLDGEITVGHPTSKTCFLDSTSALMSHAGEPDFSWWVFDDVSIWDQPFDYRSKVVEERVNEINCTGDLPFQIQALDHNLVHDMDEFLEMEEMWLDMGFEGMMYNHPKAPYKFGRSTEGQGFLLKVKRFVDAEAVIIGFVEGFTNQNVATINALGHTERSSHAENQIPSGTLGALQVRDLVHGWEFEIGTGFTAKQRQDIWDNRAQELGTYVKYQHFPVGMKDKPRFPSYKGPRDPIDM